MMHRFTALFSLCAALLAGGCTTTHPPIQITSEEAADAKFIRATADSGRNYLYFAPADFTETRKYRSAGVIESGKWLERTLFQHLDLDRHRVRVNALPGYAEVGISGRVSEAKLEEMTEKIIELRDQYKDLSPIKLICRVGEDEGPPPGTTTVDEVSGDDTNAPPAETQEPTEKEKKRTRSYDFPM